jgi:hypothetical protein
MALPSSRMNVGKIKIDQTFPATSSLMQAKRPRLLIQVKFKLVIQT